MNPPEVAELMDRLAHAEAERDHNEREWKRAARQAAHWKAEVTKQRTVHPRMQEAKALFGKYVELFDKSSRYVFGEKRQKLLIARLEESPAEDILKAFRGLKLRPYTGDGGRYPSDGPGRTLRDDIEYAIRDETAITRCMGYVDQVERERPEKAAMATREAIKRNGRNHDTPDRPMMHPLTLRRLLEALERAGRRVTGSGAQFKAQCPIVENHANGDRTPSLSITEKPDGRVLLYCQGCGAPYMDVLARLDLADLSGSVAYDPRHWQGQQQLGGEAA